jgi:hypothetical protein
MNSTSQKLCAWSAVVMAILFGVGFCVIARYLPPPSPNDSPQQIVDTITGHTTSIRIGLVLTAIGSAFLAPFAAVITVQIKRIEGRHAPLAYTNLALGAIFVLEFIFPIVILQALIYRPRSLENTLLFHDLFWLLFVGVVTTSILQFAVIGIAIIRDARAQPIYPRWVAYVNFWVALLFCSGNFIFFFKSGPLAWNGIASWWFVVVGFFIWLTAMVVTTLKAIARQHADEADSSGEALDDVAPAVRRRLERMNTELEHLRSELAGHR